MSSHTDILRPNHRILVIDDNPAIHEDLRKILTGAADRPTGLEAMESVLFGAPEPTLPVVRFELASAFQGQEGLGLLQAAVAERRPYAMAFVDIRMPPGWDGVETISQLWKVEPDLQVVICTAYSDYSWDQIVRRLGQADNLLILKKPFDNIEVVQLGHALTQKWLLTRQARLRMDELDRMVIRRTSQLQTSNRQLLQEIEQRRQAEAALRASEERFSKAFTASPIGLALLTVADDRFVDANQQFVRTTGHSREALLQSSPQELALWVDASPYPVGDGEAGGRAEGPDSVRPFRTQHGEVRHARVSMEIIRLGEVPHRLLILQDVSEQLQLEEQLRQAQKIEAVGQLAAGVAHDFNNIHAVIQGHTTLCLESAQDPDLQQSLREVMTASRRASTLTRQLLAFSRKQLIHPVPMDLNELVQQSAARRQPRLEAGVRLEVRVAPRLPLLAADRRGLEQVIHSLMDNALDAMPRGGQLILSTEEVNLGPAEVRGHPEARSGRHVVLTVVDTGTGMDNATLSRAFEPFFTTKAVGQGSGLGLSSAHGIVRQLDGWIEAQSELGRGSRFRVFLPAIEPPEAPAAEPMVHGAGNSLPRATVLLVEDEPALLHLGKRTLESAGYGVLTARCAQEALDVWEQHAESIQLVVTDVTMPGQMNGRDLAQRLTACQPELPVILASGLDVEPDPAAGSLPGVQFLAKPYEARELLQRIEQLRVGSPARAR